MMGAGVIPTLRLKYETLEPFLNERARRLWSATEAMGLGHGGIAALAEATGMSRTTISQAIQEVQQQRQAPGSVLPVQRSRRPGAGRKPLIKQDPALLTTLELLVAPTTRGDPMSPLRWTCKSTRKLAEQLRQYGYQVSERTVAHLLHQLNYSLQANRKTREGDSHPDRNAQFEYINTQVVQFQKRGQPVVSVDTKKKELIGNFKNSGAEWQPEGSPELVNVYDFKDEELGKGIPYGIYDQTTNRGWVSVGIDHDTAYFATETLRRWWWRIGSKDYPQAKELLVVADGGGSNSSRGRLWKVAVQGLADQIGLTISVCHFPPGTSKWNKIEHRMFCHITENWRGVPLRSLEIMVNLIGHTKTRTGLRIEAELDTNHYEVGLKVSDVELAAVQITKADFHGEWNYKISPRLK
jgi:biotin operon repressor